MHFGNGDKPNKPCGDSQIRSQSYYSYIV